MQVADSALLSRTRNYPIFLKSIATVICLVNKNLLFVVTVRIYVNMRAKLKMTNRKTMFQEINMLEVTIAQ